MSSSDKRQPYVNTTTKFSSVTVYCADTPDVRWEQPSAGLLQQQEGVHIWYIDKRRFSKEQILNFRKFLSEEEKIKADRFHFEKDQNRYIITHGISNQLIANYVNIKLTDISFEKNAKQKPFLKDFPHLQFNITYSLDYILIAFRFCDQKQMDYSNLQIGVDVEDVNRSIDIALIIKDYFTFEEQEEILNNSSPANIFFKLWTRKEALVKATGTGLTNQLKTYNLFPPVSKLLIKEQFVSHFYSQKLFIHSFKINESGIGSIAIMENDEPLRFIKY